MFPVFTPAPASAGGPAFERHFVPEELGKLWGLSPNVVHALFKDEPGVLKIDRPEKLHKRRYGHPADSCVCRGPRPHASRCEAEGCMTFTSRLRCQSTIAGSFVIGGRGGCLEIPRANSAPKHLVERRRKREQVPDFMHCRLIGLLLPSLRYLDAPAHPGEQLPTAEIHDDRDVGTGAGEPRRGVLHPVELKVLRPASKSVPAVKSRLQPGLKVNKVVNGIQIAFVQQEIMAAVGITNLEPVGEVALHFFVRGRSSPSSLIDLRLMLRRLASASFSRSTKRFWGSSGPCPPK